MPESPPRTLLVGNGIRGGGAERRFRLLAERLFGGQAEAAALVGDAGMHQSHGVHWLGWRGPASYPAIIWRLRRLLMTGRYDVVVTFGFYPTVVGWAARKGLRRPPRFVASEITRPEAEMALRGRNWLRYRLYITLGRLAYSACDLLTANSIDGLSETTRLYHVGHNQAMRLPNIVDPAETAVRAGQKPLTALDQAPYLITVSRFDPMKHVDVIISAFQAARLPDAWRLLIVGNGPQREEMRLRSLARGAGRRIRFLGWLENPLPVVKHAVGYVHASSYEGFSNSILEAMFCDTPVLTSIHSSDAREMCEAGAALGFEVGDVAALARNMERLETEAGLHQKLISAARNYRMPHAVENAIATYEAVIMTACDDRAETSMESVAQRAR